MWSRLDEVYFNKLMLNVQNQSFLKRSIKMTTVILVDIINDLFLLAPIFWFFKCMKEILQKPFYLENPCSLLPNGLFMLWANIFSLTLIVLLGAVKT